MLKLNNNKITKNTMIAIGLLSFIFGVSLLSYDYFQNKKLMAYDTMNSKLFANDTDEDKRSLTDEIPTTVDTTVTEIVDDTPKNVDSKESYQYIGYLEIPKIKLKKGFLDIKDKNNTIEKNIQVVETSSYPNVDKGNLIIAGHSGSGYKAFFNDLEKLVEGDMAYVYYNSKRYTYQITKKYTQPRTGNIGIYRDYNKTSITLITCTRADKKTQTIYIGELIRQEDY